MRAAGVMAVTSTGPNIQVEILVCHILEKKRPTRRNRKTHLSVNTNHAILEEGNILITEAAVA